MQVLYQSFLWQSVTTWLSQGKVASEVVFWSWELLSAFCPFMQQDTRIWMIHLHCVTALERRGHYLSAGFITSVCHFYITIQQLLNENDRKRAIKRFYFPITMLKNIQVYCICVQLWSEAVRVSTFSIIALKFYSIALFLWDREKREKKTWNEIFKI